LRVSTVLLGTSAAGADALIGMMSALIGNPRPGMAWASSGLPYETMVFVGEGSRDIFCRRYATEEEALSGHEETVKKFSVDDWESEASSIH